MAPGPLPRLLLRAEGAVLFGAALAVYLDQDFSLLLALVLLFAPDVSFVGFLAGLRIGSYVYNALHTTVGPLVLGAVGVVADARLAVAIAVIWLAHIGIDRAIGYGLKYPTSFRETHLQRV